MTRRDRMLSFIQHAVVPFTFVHCCRAINTTILRCRAATISICTCYTFFFDDEVGGAGGRLRCADIYLLVSIRVRKNVTFSIFCTRQPADPRNDAPFISR